MKICVLYYTRGLRGIQPERLNAEGDSLSARSRGLSVSATPRNHLTQEMASGRRENSRQSKWYSRSSHHGGRDYTEGYATLHPRLRATRCARAFDLSGRAAVKQVIVSISEADFWVGWEYTTPVAALPLCGANHKSASSRLCCGYRAGMAVVLRRIFTDLGGFPHYVLCWLI